MIEKDLNKVLNYMKQYVENKYEHDSEPMLNWKDLKLVLDEIERLNNTLKDIKEYFNKRKEEYSNCKSKNNINYIHYGQLLCDLQRIIDKN